jgi:succinylarginine dihydrolase
MTAVTTPEAIETVRLMTLRQALKLEIVGMKRSGKSAHTLLRQIGFKGNKEAILNQLNQEINSRLPADWEI